MQEWGQNEEIPHPQDLLIFGILLESLKEHFCTQKKNMNSLNVEYLLAMNIQNLDKNG